MYTSNVTTKGQVTIPIDIRRMLGLMPHSKVSFIVEDNEVKITQAQSVVARTAGMLKSDLPPLSAEELRDAAEEAIAQDVMERSSR